MHICVCCSPHLRWLFWNFTWRICWQTELSEGESLSGNSGQHVDSRLQKVHRRWTRVRQVFRDATHCKLHISATSEMNVAQKGHIETQCIKVTRKQRDDFQNAPDLENHMPVVVQTDVSPVSLLLTKNRLHKGELCQRRLWVCTMHEPTHQHTNTHPLVLTRRKVLFAIPSGS